MEHAQVSSGRKNVGLAVKRVVDVVGAVVILLVALPMLLIVVGLVYVKMGRPIFFLQERPGLGGKVFRICKFRTMLDLCDADGTPLPDGERLTRVGRFLRATSIDELPQLVNVLKGEMSLVGPRPLPCHYMPLYSPVQARRHDMRPGITGWAQVSGRNGIDWQEKFRIDVLYVESWSLWIDLRILLATVLAVIRRTGITQYGHPTVDCFRGNEYEQGQAVGRA